MPQGAFAEAQAEFLSPDREVVAELDRLLADEKIGVVAHFYMDPELQGVLSACEHPHVHISDSLLMADAAVRMAREGAEHIVVLGVDFMSENARAMLDASGFESTPVYRVAAAPIGCSLAESAESPEYLAYLREASHHPSALHIVYINTSLATKAKAQAIVPTITCTSSNVVSTVLTAAAQIEDVEIFFGPDTYMGQNLAALLANIATLDDAHIAALHPAHDRKSIQRLIERFHYFESGACIVHHMFGEQVAQTVRESYPDAFVTAHLEVPGEMFRIALERQRQGDRGVAGSTSNILAFIEKKVEAAFDARVPQRLSFVLGTEASMITSIANSVRKLLRSRPGSGVEVEIIFPVASEAISQVHDPELPIVPGVSGGEGCTPAGGCATCPYMKMNSLDALLGLCRSLGGPKDLSAFHPKKYTELVAGRAAADIGTEPILHMRTFSRNRRLPAELVVDVQTRHALRRGARDTVSS